MYCFCIECVKLPMHRSTYRYDTPVSYLFPLCAPLGMLTHSYLTPEINNLAFQQSWVCTGFTSQAGVHYDIRGGDDTETARHRSRTHREDDKSESKAYGADN